MPRHPLNITSSSDILIYSRCDGKIIELVVASDEEVILKEISPEEALVKARELINCAMQILEKRA